jgi:hypothetical protein
LTGSEEIGEFDTALRGCHFRVFNHEQNVCIILASGSGNQSVTHNDY